MCRYIEIIRREGETIKKNNDQARGCLLGAAAGDALGAPIEFLNLDQIRERYGEEGLTDYASRDDLKPGSYTDDTQMTLATAVGCIRAIQLCKEGKDCDFKTIVYQEYLEWYEMQKDPDNRRAPGGTCLGALGSGKMGTIEEKINDSKGCGGVMRTAPVGLAFRAGEAFLRGAEIAAITHGHPSGYLPAGFLAEMIARIIEGKTIEEAFELSLGVLTVYAGHEETLQKIGLAREMALTGKEAAAAIPLLGEGWVGDEALAIALYCAFSYPSDWKKAVLTAVNITGDSDSTGSVTGAILGALLGEKAIPAGWVKRLENSTLIMRIAGDISPLKITQ